MSPPPPPPIPLFLPAPAFGLTGNAALQSALDAAIASVSIPGSSPRFALTVVDLDNTADNNPGTFPIQSERLYQAIRGNGGKVRFVSLPYEGHGYFARESVEHTVYEMLAWFDKYVKNAPASDGDRPGR